MEHFQGNVTYNGHYARAYAIRQNSYALIHANNEHVSTKRGLALISFRKHRNRSLRFQQIYL